MNTGGSDGLRPGEEVFLCVLPLFHIYALTFNLLLAVRLAGRSVLHLRFDPGRVLAEIAEKRATVFFGVPTMFTALNACPGLDQADLGSLRFCNSGGAPLPGEIGERFRRVTGQTVQEGWGMTEMCGVGTVTPRGTIGPPGACGIPLCGVDIRFLDVNDPQRYVAYGERGEICVAGPNVLGAYWKKPEATAESMTADGYFRTGDVGSMDENGYLTIADRIKDMLLCSGFNVYPRAIEEAIYRHPSVAEVIVIGVADAYRGQHPKAYIRLRDGAAPFTLDELKLFLKDALGKHEMVHTMEIRDALPKTPVGKLSKKELYQEEQDRAASAAINITKETT
jgi:long-chain acyl-CoA synthetase